MWALLVLTVGCVLVAADPLRPAPDVMDILDQLYGKRYHLHDAGHPTNIDTFNYEDLDFLKPSDFKEVFKKNWENSAMNHWKKFGR